MGLGMHHWFRDPVAAEYHLKLSTTLRLRLATTGHAPVLARREAADDWSPDGCESKAHHRRRHRLVSLTRPATRLRMKPACVGREPPLVVLGAFAEYRRRASVASSRGHPQCQ